MGLLTISKKLEKDHPEIVVMALKWLEKECNAHILDVAKGANTEYYIEGDTIPMGNEQFDVIFRTIVPQVFAISIR